MTDQYYLPTLGLICALGQGSSEIAPRLLRGDTSGLVAEDGWLPTGASRVGRARGELPEIPPAFSANDCRNSRLLLAALAQIREAVDAARSRFGSDRLGIVLGTSTSGIAEGGEAIAVHRARGALPAAQMEFEVTTLASDQPQ